jgi:formate C-acetyltransferase
LESSLSSIKNDIIERKEEIDKDFKTSLLLVIDGLFLFSKRIISSYWEKQGDRQKQLEMLFTGLLDRKPESLDEALQKILFYNDLFWQYGHRLVGLGRLDMILFPYYEKDINYSKLTREKAKYLLKEFLLILSKNLEYKSGVLLGDTGQVIMLGGIDKNGNSVENELTYVFLELIKEMNIPDPKLI